MKSDANIIGYHCRDNLQRVMRVQIGLGRITRETALVERPFVLLEPDVSCLLDSFQAFEQTHHVSRD